MGPITDHDDKILGRVRALLAKAESTPYPEEAEALTAKAQELMARHSIDAALAAAGDDRRARGAPARRRLVIAPPYVTAKVHLISAVARANRCEAVWTKSEGQGVVFLFGYDVDLDAVDLLFTSLLLQATAAALAAGSQVDTWGRSRTRSFRSAFLVSFAARIGERLAEAAEHAVGEAVAAEEDAGVLLPVLADRADAVRAARDEEFPRVRRTTTRVSNGAGWQAGRAAAERASLTGQSQVAGRHRALDP